MNNKVDDKWLKEFRERMEDYSEPLPEGMWEKLESDLAQPKVIPFWRRWPSVAAAVALVLVVSSLALSDWFSPVMESSDMKVANQVAEEMVGGDLVVPVAPVNAVAQTEECVAPTPNAVAQKAVARAFVVQTENTVAQTEGEVSRGDEAAQTDEPQNSHSDYESYRTTTRTRMMDNRSYAYRAPKHSADRGIELGLHTGGMPYNASKQFAGMSRLAPSRTMSLNNQLVMTEGMNGKMTAYSQVLLSNRDKQSKTAVKHKMPVNVVASVKWHFADNWALESGLSYTFLQSELHSGSNLYWEETQKLHYVGIPIKLHRSIWGNDLMQIYASAGGMLEKCVSGSFEAVYVTSNSTKEKEENSIHSHPFQWSLAAAVGAQVNLIHQLSLFVEPGVAYFFDDNSRLETIRKEHPFNFNLQFGLRFNLNR